jgi:hypothetical protein
MTECGLYNTVGSRCVQPEGHTGHHESAYGAKWTDESNRVAAELMAKQISGRD